MNFLDDYEQELRTSHLPCCFFVNTSLSLSIESPRLFIFSTSKSSSLRLLPVICSPNNMMDPLIIIEVNCEHFKYRWETRLSMMEQNSQSWLIKPTNPCGLDPFQLQIIVTVNGERKTLFDRYANIVCKASEFPKGLAHLLIQERNGLNVTPDVFSKLKKKKPVPGIRLELPHLWDSNEKWRLIDNIWYTLDSKNANRPLCKTSGPFPILQPSQQFIDSISSNPLGQYRSIWIWIYGVLRFYTMYYNTMRDHVGKMPECIDRRTAEERLYNSQIPSLIIRFGREGENIICTTWENGKFEHYQFSWKTKPSAKSAPFSELPKYLLQLKSRNFQYLSPQEFHIRLDDVIQIFSICLNQPMRNSGSISLPDTKSLIYHCKLMNQYINDTRQTGRSLISLDQIEQSINTIIKQYDINLYNTPGNNGLNHIPTPSSYPPPQLSSNSSMFNQSIHVNQPLYETMQQHHNFYNNQQRSTLNPPPNPFKDSPMPNTDNNNNDNTNPFNDPILSPMADDVLGLSGDQFLELVNSSGPDDLFSSLYPQGKKRKLHQAFDNSTIFL